MLFKTLLVLFASLLGVTVIDSAIEENTAYKVGNKIEVTDEDDDSDEGIFLLSFDEFIAEEEM